MHGTLKLRTDDARHNMHAIQGRPLPDPGPPNC
jgi:hypothetical protein